MIDYDAVLAPYGHSFVDELHQLADEVFGNIEREEIVWRLKQMPNACVHTARDGQLVGFKLGYAVAKDRYHSWLGAVRGPWRRKGIALGLMERQHAWLRTQGYTSVETATIPHNMPMLGLNLRAGFRVIGSYRRGEQMRVTLAKDLSTPKSPRACSSVDNQL
jgi:GNAT superfamily N-acetyltransferase